MNIEESLEKFRTVAFAYEIVRPILVVSGDGRINLDKWFTIVPACYRARVLFLAQQVFANGFANTRATPERLDEFVIALLRVLRTDLTEGFTPP
jgi:hypothetical protein